MTARARDAVRQRRFGRQRVERASGTCSWSLQPGLYLYPISTIGCGVRYGVFGCLEKAIISTSGGVANTRGVGAAKTLCVLSSVEAAKIAIISTSESIDCSEARVGTIPPSAAVLLNIRKFRHWLTNEAWWTRDARSHASRAIVRAGWTGETSC